jgi:hypothetical protein
VLLVLEWVAGWDCAQLILATEDTNFGLTFFLADIEDLDGVQCPCSALGYSYGVQLSQAMHIIAYAR